MVSELPFILNNHLRLRVMKNSCIKLAVLAMAAFVVSCQVSETFDDSYVPEKGDIVFRLGNSTNATKSSETETMSIQGVTIDLGTEGDKSFYLEETITRLDGQANGPETKGTPAYTENVGVLYKTLGLYAAGKFGNVTFDRLDNEMVGGGWRYKHNYTDDPWPDNSDEKVGFYLRMPVTMNGVTTTMTAAAPYGIDASGSAVAGAITFNYTSPTKVEDMQDIGFAYRTMSENDYKGYGKNGAPFLFNHALTGVKFAIGNTAEDIAANEIAITEVIFNGLYDKGTCTIKPVSENNYRDNTGNYSSSSDGVVVWTGKEATTVSTVTGYSSGTFSTTLQNYATSTKDDKGNTVLGHFTKNGNYPDSFAEAGATNNLNDADATKTFWFIPQSLSRTAAQGTEGEEGYVAGETPVTLTVKYTYRNEPGTWVIDFGTILSNIEWKAGELRTYTLRIADVNVKIEDRVNMADTYEDWQTATNSYKDNVVITNTGNTPAFIRASIIGQWIDSEGRPVFAFTDYQAVEPIKNVPSWYQDQFGSSPKYNFGYFSGLVGYDATSKWPDEATKYSGSHWHKGTDGYYYYDQAVPVEESTEEPLFEKYVMKLVPDIRVVNVPQEVTFVLEVATQAISANKTNGQPWGDDNYAEAWRAAASR